MQLVPPIHAALWQPFQSRRWQNPHNLRVAIRLQRLLHERCLTLLVMPLHPRIIRIALAAAVMCACVKKTAPVTPQEAARGRILVQSLTDEKARDTAYCELLRLRLYHRPRDAYQDTCGPVSEVVNAPQQAGSPLYIVFTKPEYAIEREPIRRGPAGPFSIFDSNGYIVPVFSSANVVNYESESFTYSPAGEVAVGNVFGVTHGSAFDAGHWSVQTLNIIPTTDRSRRSASCLVRRLSASMTNARETSGLGATPMPMRMDGQRFRSDREQTLKEPSRRRRRSGGRASIKGTSVQAEVSRSSSSNFSPAIAWPSTPTPKRGGA